MNKYIEINKDDAKAGRTPVKIILHKIFPNSKSYNENGISWSRQYTEQNKDSVNGMPLVCQFLDKNNEIPFGSHGDAIINDGNVTFEDSVVVGSFESSYVDDNLQINGEIISGLVGIGYIYNQRFPSLIDYLQNQYNAGNNVDSSVEICADKSKGFTQIVYDGEYKEFGRIPKYYQYSATAFCIGVKPADNSAIMLELNSAKTKKSKELDDTNSFDNKNNKYKEVNLMDEKMIEQFVSDIKNTVVEINSKNAEYEEKINTITGENAILAETNTKNEELIKAKDTKVAELNQKIADMEIELNNSKKEMRKIELNSVLADYSDEEKDFAKTEIEAFTANPMSVEVNSIVDKILKEIGKKSIEAKKVVETNSKKEEVKLEDIFGDISEINSKNNEEISIF